MEHFAVTLDDGTGKAYDEALKDSLPEGGDLKAITKNDGTVQGNPIVLLTFTVQMPDGTIRKAQAATSVKLFLFAARLMAAKYGDLLT